MSESHTFGQRIPVIIVGAGPVGLTASLVLARAGVESVLLEATPKLVEDLRTTIIQPSSLEMWSALDADEGFREYGTKCPTMQFRERTGGVVANLDYSCLAKDTSFPHILLCALPYVVPTLHKALLATGRAQVLFGHKVEEARQRDSEVVVTGKGPSGSFELRAAFVIGADGTRSVVREGLDIARQRVAQTTRLFRVTVDAPIEDYLPGVENYSYVMDPFCFGLVLRNPEFWRVPIGLSHEGPETAELAPVDSDGQRLMRECMFAGKPIDITAARPLIAPNWIATEFGVGRILLAGDSAHAMNPMAGTGMNSGVLDAVDAALATREAVALGEPGVLWRRYVATRPNVARDIATRAMSRYYLLTERDEERRAQRNRWLAGVASDEARRRTCLTQFSLLDRFWDLRPGLERALSMKGGTGRATHGSYDSMMRLGLGLR